ncbi:antibiotic acetyltransferase, partial [Staphylococcus aureus]|nr:antibiotic acetyltransferase [Staphylococcus aureus]
MALLTLSIIGLLKNQSSKESNVKIHRLAYITNSKFDGNNYIDRWC